MTTSGTVGTTQFDVARVIEKTYRRCGVPTGGITPELIEIAKENLFLLFQTFSNRGINLWCVEKNVIALASNKRTYDMPVGVIDVLNASYRQITEATPDITSSDATSITTQFASATSAHMIKLVASAAYTQLQFTVSSSDDGVTYAVFYSSVLTDLTAGEQLWVAFDPVISAHGRRRT